MITWTPIAHLPDELKDGRNLLLWTGAMALIGAWFHGCLRDMDDGSEIEPTHFAEITPP